MASIEEAAAGLAAALDSGNAQDAEAAKALYSEALGDDEAPEVSLEPLKRSLADLEAEQAAEAAGDDELAEEDIAGAEGVEEQGVEEPDATAAAEDDLAEAAGVDRILVSGVEDAAASDES